MYGMFISLGFLEEHVQLPAGLTNLCFGFDFDQSLRNVQLVGLRAGRLACQLLGVNG